jgi:hypothetical protein
MFQQLVLTNVLGTDLVISESVTASMDIKGTIVLKVYVQCCVQTMENMVVAFVIVKKVG